MSYLLIRYWLAPSISFEVIFINFINIYIYIYIYIYPFYLLSNSKTTDRSLQSWLNSSSLHTSRCITEHWITFSIKFLSEWHLNEYLCFCTYDWLEECQEAAQRFLLLTSLRTSSQWTRNVRFIESKIRFFITCYLEYQQVDFPTMWKQTIAAESWQRPHSSQHRMSICLSNVAASLLFG